MMKEPKLASPVLASRISSMSASELEVSQSCKRDPAYFFAPNAFINVIDIMREQVIA